MSDENYEDRFLECEQELRVVENKYGELENVHENLKEKYNSLLSRLENILHDYTYE